MESMLALESSTGNDPANAAVLSRSPPSCTGCALPLGKAMRCGLPRHRLELPPNTELMSYAGPGRDLWLVRSGLLRLQRYGQDGRRQILSLYLPGEIVGYDKPLREGLSIETATASGLCRIDRRTFDTLLAGNRALRDDVFRQKRDQLDRLYRLTWSLGALSPESRLSAFLVLSSRFMPYQALADGTGILAMQLPRADIADLLATTVESISRITHRLADMGVIEIVDASHFRLVDFDRLSALGQISGSLDQITRRMNDRRNRLNGLLGPSPDSPVALCGR